MKHLPITDKAHLQLIGDFKSHLETLGYGKSARSTMPSQLREFFYRLEQQGIKLEGVTPEHVQKHHEYLCQRPNSKSHGGLGLATAHHHMFALKTFFKYRQETGQSGNNPFGPLDFPSPEKKERQPLSREQVGKLYGACATLRGKAILALFYGCGLRRSEAIKLNTADIDFKQQLLYVREGKGKKRRVVPLAGKVLKDLGNYLTYERGFYLERDKPQEAFMINNNGTRMLGNSYLRTVKELIRGAGLPNHITIHHLRHSIATHLLESGLGLEQVRDFLGHTELDTTQIYTKVKPNKTWS